MILRLVLRSRHCFIIGGCSIMMTILSKRWCKVLRFYGLTSAAVNKSKKQLR